jgi:pumilio RNA-binding family
MMRVMTLTPTFHESLENGNHVIQKCIERVPPPRIQFVVAAFYGRVRNRNVSVRVSIIHHVVYRCESGPSTT